jgi:asparagine synthase (glutamine-hydrolysing)
MCGIAGFFDRNKFSSESILMNMIDTLIHRGPDGKGTFINEEEIGTVGLGHRRLSIIDLTETGTQPMNYNHLWITFNGEIYNYQSIRKELTQLGHKFYGNSDTEVILHAYEEWGVSCANRFNGMYAFVIYDSKAKKIIAFRDRAGVKPFFYYWNDGLFMFSSELKAFHEHPNFKKIINTSAVAHFIQYGNVPGHLSIFQNVHKLRPGHYLEFDLKTFSFETQQYWNIYSFYNKKKLFLPFDEASIETENRMKKAFEYRMVSDVPVGVFLSGGYDSTSVTALLQKERTEKLKTFTIAVPDAGLNEAPFAKEIANFLGTDHTEIYCSVDEALELIPNLPFYYDEPFADSSAIPTMLVSKYARQQVTVALSADGGDELFAGYNRYDYLIRFGQKINKLPKFVRKSAALIMETIPADSLPIIRKKYNFPQRYDKIKTILKDSSNESIMLSLSQQYTQERLQLLLIDFPHLEKDLAYYSKEMKREFYSPLSFMMAIDFQTYMVDDVLQKVDRATMAFSLEGREPFLDPELIDWVAQLPDDYKYFKGTKKRLLKEIVHKYVPKEMMDRPKMGFAIPIADWLSKELKPIVNAYINEDCIKSQGIFNWKSIERLKLNVFSGKKEYAQKLWYILMFQMWYERWMIEQ